MKKLILITALVFVIGISYGQSLEKGNLVGVHTLTITLNPGVTMEQVISYLINSYIPASEKARPEWKYYITKGVRGENNNEIGMIAVVRSEKDRDKYFNADGTIGELGLKANEKIKAYNEELNKLCTWTSKYTDWVIQ